MSLTIGNFKRSPVNNAVVTITVLAKAAIIGCTIIQIIPSLGIIITPTM